MGARKRCLPPGWYPETAEQTLREIAEMGGRTPGPRGPVPAPSTQARQACAGILPHAGWHFSGRLALEVLSSLARGIDTIVIIGGHMRSTDRIVSAFEDSYDTPLGELKADLRLLEALRPALDIREDRERDNTVEVHLPLVRYLAPAVMVLGMRAPPSPLAAALGKAIVEAAAILGRRVAVAGSTDLTHYGSNYDFSPAGSGAEAQRWVREVNDRRIIESMLHLDVESALERARQERSACSIGGAVAAMHFARASGVSAGNLVGYLTSSDVYPGESFVGYAGVLYTLGESAGA
ncbi:MAG: AmmeMemoRadiSam system protein B [Spirochaetia bacterium]